MSYTIYSGALRSALQGRVPPASKTIVSGQIFTLHSGEYGTNSREYRADSQERGVDSRNYTIKPQGFAAYPREYGTDSRERRVKPQGFTPYPQGFTVKPQENTSFSEAHKAFRRTLSKKIKGYIMADWMPHKRDDILNMGKVWMTVLAKNAAAWGIPTDEVSDLAGLVSAADAILATAKGADRTPTVTAKCKAAFDALEKKLRYLKERYIHMPPLRPEDYPPLLLTVPDAVKSPVPPPTGFAEADISYPGPGVLALHCRPMQEQPPLDSRSDYGYKIYYGVMPQGGATVEQATGTRRLLMKVPAIGDELPRSVWTRRKNEKLDFHEDRGSTVYFCIRYENAKGQAGPWGAMFNAIVP